MRNSTRKLLRLSQRNMRMILSPFVDLAQKYRVPVAHVARSLGTSTRQVQRIIARKSPLQPIHDLALAQLDLEWSNHGVDWAPTRYHRHNRFDYGGARDQRVQARIKYAGYDTTERL